ncbi:MAG: hypothetical protein HWD58_14790 [Bacteroidota bacterium]|nr:MAG: hypothetical protein HWD58_14790 [Bacteroidota bacterium]
MKKFLLLFGMSFFTFLVNLKAQGNDDLYSDGSEYSQDVPQTTPPANSNPAMNYDSYDDGYSNTTSQRSYSYDDESYIDYDDDEYYYTSRIRRFYRPFWSFGYFSGFYWDPYWWDWSCNYPSWNVGWGWNNGWNNWGWNSGWNNWGWNNGWNNWGWNNGWNNWGCNNWGWNNGWNNWGCNNGWNNWGWNNGYSTGYTNGYYNGYWDGFYPVTISATGIELHIHTVREHQRIVR